ncbi:MAG: hypothetical protein HFF17_00630 [Oscillospiraceae bacterium]|nr:hypothetical protein [Oscillospiraceae bacterium]
MDNVSFHSKKQLFLAAPNAGCRLLFLPPYSPELNPFEKFRAWLKRFLKKILPLMIPFMLLFNCGDYTILKREKAERYPGRPLGATPRRRNVKQPMSRAFHP